MSTNTNSWSRVDGIHENGTEREFNQIQQSNVIIPHALSFVFSASFDVRGRIPGIAPTPQSYINYFCYYMRRTRLVSKVLILGLDQIEVVEKK